VSDGANPKAKIAAAVANTAMRAARCVPMVVAGCAGCRADFIVSFVLPPAVLNLTAGHCFGVNDA
jgi:hypothetical protein